MPATRVTLVNNVKQTQRTILLVPQSISFDPSNPSSCRDLVLKTAKSKFQSKKSSRVFDITGKELLTQKDWEQAIRNDISLLVSKHDEDYIGSSAESKKGASSSNLEFTNPQCPVVQLNAKAEADSLSLTQLETTARTLPGIVYAVAQPDIHPGTKYPIGGVFVSKGWIHPPLIGSDIGCGMAWYKTSLNPEQVEGE